jgi:asparagine synthase (glutamine-hydrolysing)
MDFDHNFRYHIRSYLKTYLPNEILFKLDRASMLNSVEARSPFLDYNLADFLLGPNEIARNLQGPGGKVRGRSLVGSQFGSYISDQPKVGFEGPVSSIVKELIKSNGDFVSDLSDFDTGFLNLGAITSLLKDSSIDKVELNGNLGLFFYALYSFQIWAKNN